MQELRARRVVDRLRERGVPAHLHMAQASRFGVLPADIDNILYDAFGQREVAQYFTGNKAYYVILEALPSQYGVLSTLDKLYVHASTGAAVPLSTSAMMAASAASASPPASAMGNSSAATPRRSPTTCWP